MSAKSNVGNPELERPPSEQEDDEVREVIGIQTLNKSKGKRKKMKDRSEVWEHFLKKETDCRLWTESCVQVQVL